MKTLKEPQVAFHAMHPRAEAFAAAASDQHDVDIDVHEFESGTKTAADAAAAIGCDVAQIASSLVFVAGGEPIVIVTSGANRVSEGRLADVLDVDEDAIRMATPDEVRDETGWSIGGVPPFCHERDLRVLIDATLLDHDEVWAAAGTPKGVFPIDPDRLLDVARAEPAVVAE